MDVPFGGGCACGAVRYECTGAPRYMGNCHCTACQQATGNAYFPAVMVKESEFSLLEGEPSRFERPSDKGHPMRGPTRDRVVKKLEFRTATDESGHMLEDMDHGEIKMEEAQ